MARLNHADKQANAVRIMQRDAARQSAAAQFRQRRIDSALAKALRAIHDETISRDAKARD